MNRTRQDVIKLLTRLHADPTVVGELAAATSQLRVEVRDTARSVRRLNETLRALERDSTRERDGDAYQNRAIAIVRGVERDLRFLLEREASVFKFGGRSLARDYRDAHREIEPLQNCLVANRKAGNAAVAERCRSLCRAIHALLQQGQIGEAERWLYAATGTLILALVELSVATGATLENTG